MSEHFFILYIELQIFFCVDSSQSVKILTYREPQNPEYKDFVSKLKTDAMDMFNFSLEDSLVRVNQSATKLTKMIVHLHYLWKKKYTLVYFYKEYLLQK